MLVFALSNEWLSLACGVEIENVLKQLFSVVLPSLSSDVVTAVLYYVAFAECAELGRLDSCSAIVSKRHLGLLDC